MSVPVSRVTVLALLIAACDSTAATVDATPGSGDASTAPDAAVPDCTAATTHLAKAVCAADGFLATLSTSERAAVNLAFTDSADRTRWSNLPGVTRAGVAMGALGDASQAAALALMQTVLSSDGSADLEGVRAADDYLASLGGGGGGGGGAYGAANYSIAVFGTPSESGDWAVTFGGHHMAWNITYHGGVGYPTPNHLGVEPKAAFTIDGATYQPMAGEGDALAGVFGALSSTELASAYLAGQTFSDVLIGPVEYGTGSAAAAQAKFPVGANRKGVLVSSLSADQQALVTSAIAEWVSDYDPAIASDLLAAYTSSAAYADTYVAWAGTPAAGVDVDVSGTYMRIDGPRVWIEVACQSGVVVQGATHYHGIYRDKALDYSGTL
ncbi:MAG: DUF3500 domain-containing protein [Deltaproteobacteria bacterium]|nr:DUF3500 domain-containing protein [Deltaproteobacteria bacterium]